jgi:tRNA dimethylallyltransferase
MQVYRGMDIGTAKPSAADRATTRHHLIDLVGPEVDFTVADFQQAAHEAMEGLGTDVTPIVAGGSGLHFRAVVDPLTFAPSDPDVREDLESTDPALLVEELLAADPEAARHVDLANPRRVIRAVEIHRLSGETPSSRAGSAEAEAVRRYESRIRLVAVGFDPGERIEERVRRRIAAMLDEGLIDEVAQLAGRMGRTARQAVGYKELLAVVTGESRLDEARENAVRSTLGLVKRQRTFFRRDPRIVWLPWHDDVTTRLRNVLDVVEGEPACAS